jgi:uncharacterized protein YceK
MKKILLIAAALVLAGCGEKKAEAPAAEGGMAAQADSMSMMKSDTTMARDSAK